MDLKELQIIFSSVVTKQIEQGSQKTHSSKEQQLINLITGGGSLLPDGALGVYFQDYQARMREALSKNYEATWVIMGDDEFFQYADTYIYTHPSDLSNLTNYGEEFPDLLAANDELSDATEMSRFERAFWRYFHAGDRPSLTIDEERIINGEFNLSSFTFIESEMRLDLIWSHREEGVGALDELEIFEPSYFLIYKAHDFVEIKRVSKEIYSFLINLRDCKKISSVADREISPSTWTEIFNILKFSED